MPDVRNASMTSVRRTFATLLFYGRRSRLSAFLLLCALLWGCGGKEVSPKEDVLLDLTFIAAKDINPNSNGRPSPLAVRTFHLAATDAFEEADYFALQTDAKKTLGDTLLPGGDKFVIRPGGREIIRRKLPPGVTALGIIAGYRDISHATWQTVHMIPPPPEAGWFSSPLKITLEIRLQESDIQVTPRR